MTLLPANATAVERAIESVITASPALRDTVESIPGIKFDAPEILLPWLVHEYGLAEVSPYIGDLRRVIADGLIWQRRRGTQDALFRALGWINFVLPSIEEEEPGAHWSEIQIDPGRIPSDTEIRAIQALTELSIPARSRLSRIHHGYDVRRFVLNQSLFGDLLSDYSGVTINGLVLSFGRYQTCSADRSQTIPVSFRKTTRHLLAVYRDKFVLDHSFFGETPLPNNPMTHAVLRGFVAGSLAAPPHIAGRTTSRAQAVLSGDDLLDSLNEQLSPRIRVEIGQPMVLSDSQLDEEIHGFKWQPVDIYPERIHGVTFLDETLRTTHQCRSASHGHAWKRRFWPELSGDSPNWPVHRNRQVTRGKSTTYGKQPWLDARWPKEKTWNNLNAITGMNHVRSN